MPKMDDIEVVIELDTSRWDAAAAAVPTYTRLPDESYTFEPGDFERQVRAMQAAMEKTPEDVERLRANLIQLGTTPPA